MIVYNLPSTIKPKNVSYRLVSKSSLNKSAFTGHEVIYHYPDKHWEILAEYPRMREDVAKEFQSVFSAMNNKTDVLKFFPSTNISSVSSIGDFVSNNGNLYEVVNLTGCNDGGLGRSGGALHLYPAKKSNWSDADIKENTNVFIYCSITEDFEFDYDLAVTTGINIPLREFVQTGTQTVETFDNIHEIDSSEFTGYYYYGDDGTHGTGYYHPLFLTQSQANSYSGGDGTNHTHTFDTAPSVPFYMPNGLSGGNKGHGASTLNTNPAKKLTRHYFSTDIVEYPQATSTTLFAIPYKFRGTPTKLSTDDLNAPIGGGY